LKAFYYDIVNFDPPAVRLALHFAGEDRIRAGSDYPHQIGSIPLMFEMIAKLDVSDDVKEKIPVIFFTPRAARRDTTVDNCVKSFTSWEGRTDQPAGAADAVRGGRATRRDADACRDRPAAGPLHAKARVRVGLSRFGERARTSTR
jgi:hypothetical protein